MSKPRKRSDGESSIFKGDDGRYHGYVSMGLKAGGKRDRRHVSAKTRKEVVAKVRALENKRDAGVTETTGRAPTVEQWMTHWHATIAAQRVGPRTWRDYRDILKGRVFPAIGHMRLDRLQPEHLEDFYGKLLAQGLSAGTVLKTHRVISRALHVAHRRGRIARNIAQLVDPPRYKRDEVDPLSGDEARQILEAASVS